MSVEAIEATSEQTLEALVYELVERTNELIKVSNKQNEMLASIAEILEPTLENLKSSPLGMMLGMK